jgi:type I restriction enzyme, S subunit
VKAGWEKATLAHVCQFSNGLWKGVKPPFVNVGVIRNTNFTKDGALDDSDIAYLDVEAKKFKTRRLQFGDVILEKSGGGPKQPVGRVVLFDLAEGEFSFSNFTSALRVRDHESLDFRFLHKFLHWAYLSGVTEGMQSHSTGIRNLDGDAYKAIEITFPNLAEQKRIVGILDEALDGIATAKANAAKNLQNARALFESHLQSVFTQRGEGWVDTTIGHDIRFIDYRGKTPTKTESGLRLITAKNVKMGYVQETPMEFVAPSSYEAWMTRGIPRPGDVLFTTEAPLANVAQLDTDERVVFAQRIIIMQPDTTRLDSTFLKYLLLSPPVQQRIHIKGTGATVKGIKASLLKTVEISFPSSLTRQREIVAELDSLRKETQRLEYIYQQRLAALEELKKSLLHRAFTARLAQRPREIVLDPFPIRIANITPTDLHAGILAMAYQLHEQASTQSKFGHVKAEKIVHMVEAQLGIDLGRSPVKDAAGPNDYPHLMRVEHRAKMAGFFSFERLRGPTFHIAKRRKFDALIERTRQALGPRTANVDTLLKVMLPMDTQQAEIFATVYAAWNNLLLDRQTITDEKIVLEARENWHPDKMQIPRDKFFEAIKWIRKKNFVPLGKGKRVTGKVR